MRRLFKNRQGEIVRFDKNKILSSIARTYREVNPHRGQAIANDTAWNIYKTSIRPWVIAQKERQMKYYEVQEAVENGLMRSNPSLARAYILYNYQRRVNDGLRTPVDITPKETADNKKI